MKFHKLILGYINLVLCLSLLFPMSAFAHLIRISAVSPFPSEVFTSSSTSASYAVTNLTSRVVLTVIDQSQFPVDSGLFISFSTCGVPINPGQSCTIQLRLNAPSSPRIISTELREWASPSADGVRYPLVINITKAPNFTITPTAGAGGSISPSSPQVVNSGASLTFTAIPNAGFAVFQWLLDGVVVQTGGTTFTLNNITANHTLQVTFFSGLIAVGNYQNTSTIVTPLIFLSSNNGSTWSSVTTTLPLDFTNNGLLAASACTGINCIGAGIYTSGAINKPLLVYSSNAGSSWASVTAPVPGDFVSSAEVKDAICEGTTCVTVGTYSNGALVKPLILVSNDSGASWSAANPTLPANFLNFGILNTVTCEGSTCVAAGSYTRVGGIQEPLLIVSNNSGATWASVTPTLPPTYSNLGTINSVTCEGNTCIATGVFFEAGFQARPLILVSNNLGSSWGFVTPTLPGDFSNFGFANAVMCIGAICNTAGNYNDGSVTKPLLFHSIDSGASWSSVSTTLPANFSDTTSLRSIFCTGSNCIAAGDYTDGSFIQFPMLLVTSNQGASWTAFPLTTPSDFLDLGTINALTCSGSVCTAVGTYTNTSNVELPLIYVSSDNGINWSLVTQVLPANFSDLGILNGTSGTL